MLAHAFPFVISLHKHYESVLVAGKKRREEKKRAESRANIRRRRRREKNFHLGKF